MICFLRCGSTAVLTCKHSVAPLSEKLQGVWKLPIYQQWNLCFKTHVFDHLVWRKQTNLHIPLFPHLIRLCIAPSCSLSVIFLFDSSSIHWSAQYTQGCHLADKLENNTHHDESPIGCMQSLCASQPIKANENHFWWSLYFHHSPQWIWAHLCFSLSVHLPFTFFLTSLSVCACILCVSMRVCRVSNVGVCGNG